MQTAATFYRMQTVFHAFLPKVTPSCQSWGSCLEHGAVKSAAFSLHRHNAAIAAYWRQRAKLKDCIFGDENSAYLHICASVRHRKNQIKSLDDNGTTYTAHCDKETVLLNFFKNLVGVTCPVSTSFDLDGLLLPNSINSAQASDISRPFTLEEIKEALWAMKDDASPGPDGFGSAFYKSNWDLVKMDLLNLLNDFHVGKADLKRLNTAYIVLLPKKTDASKPENFRPVSLQNCSVKLAAKCLANRTQPLIDHLIHYEQTGFIRGRGIAENFVHATDIVQTCFKRRLPAIVIKLDFHKAFDSVSWTALAAILRAKGFPPIWCRWVDHLNSSASSAVLLNGKPGPWFQCRQGLRQGDPFSPYLFILVADVLKRLIIQASANGLLSHPIADDIPCTVLQYADDTLIVLPPDAAQLQTLKHILLQFSEATGLTINFHKSTFAPIHVDPELSTSLAAILGCPVATFPQSYLGLPLSTHKLNLADFFFIIDKVDRRLAGWRGLLLSLAGRAILVRSVLRALPIYAMSVLLLPAGTVQEIEKRCRAFFWTGQDTVTGGNCKVAWDIVCAPFINGGLGFLSLTQMNLCLLLKHISKLHDVQTMREPSYLVTKYGWSSTHDVGMSDNHHTPIWRDIMKGLEFFRSTTMVQLGNGATTSFWLDLWLPQSTQTIAQLFPALFSHSNRIHTSVARALASSDLALDLTPRLSHTAECELTELRNVLASVSVNLQVADRRISRDAGKPLTTKLAYQAVWKTRPTDTIAPAIWRNYAPNKCRIFIWLANKDRLFTNARRFRRGIATSAACLFCSQCETIEHLLFECRQLAPLWAELDSLCHATPQGILQAWEGDYNNKTRSTVLLAVLWNIWKRRNAKVFRNLHLEPHTIASSAADDLRLWSHRCKNVQKQIMLRDWGSMLFHLAGRI